MESRASYIEARSIPEPNTGCWIWLTSLGSHGYGQCIDPEDPGRKAKAGGGITVAHRVSYRAFVGDIPAGNQIDHRCRNRWCVNPEHLDAVTQQENIRRQWAAKRATHAS